MLELTASESQFVRDHLNADVRALLLRPHPAGMDIKKLVNQIAARQKARDKLPAWYANDALIFPAALSVEQASSERTAHYKASLVNGNLLLDLTGGMGVDTWAFAQRMEHVVYAEHNPELAELTAYNLPLLGIHNVVFHAGNGLDLVKSQSEVADWIYLDPHRRDEQGGKVVRLEEYEPDVSKSETIAVLLDRATRILIKVSPLLDVDRAVRQLENVETVHVVAVQGEVKEVLLTVGQRAVDPDNLLITAVNLTTAGEITFSFRKGDERTAAVTIGNPETYIYEPNAAVLKSGAFRLVATRFGLSKLAPNSHLYTSDMIKANFPGRIFRLQHVVKPERRAVASLVPAMKANLTVRNFPQTVAELRKTLGLREGGNVYILATTLQNGEKRLLITEKADLADL